MQEAIHIARAKDKTAAKLKRVFADPVLAVSGSLGSRARLGVIASKYVEDIGALQLRSAVSLTILVNEQWEVNPGFLAEFVRKVRIAQTYGSQRGASVPDFVCAFAQLRDVLAAEDSTVMAQENDDCGSIRPQRSKPHLLPFRIRQRDAGQPGAEGVVHSSHCSAAVMRLSSKGHELPGGRSVGEK